MSATAGTTIDVLTTGAPPRTRRVSGLVRGGDVVFYLLTLGAALSIVIITVWLAWQLYDNSAVARKSFGWSFLLSSDWNPVEGQFGAKPFIFGTVVTSILAMVIAVPLGVATAVFLAEMAPPKLSAALAFLIDLLAAVPSVIYGLLGIFLLLPILSTYVIPPFLSVIAAIHNALSFFPFGQWLYDEITSVVSGPFYGVSLLSAGIVLSIMIIPFVISISREVLLSVPREQREGSYALGCTRWETVWHVVLPYAKRGIFGSAFLALARALGETMAVTMVIGNDPKIASSLLAPGYTVAAVIANEFTEATGDDYISALIFLGLVLFGITFVINGLARLMILTLTEKHHHA